MSKKQRGRRNRQPQIRKPKPPAAPERHLFPNGETPLLEVLFHPDVDVPDTARQTALAYWGFSTPGTWTHKVAEIGAPHQVYKAVKNVCHAVLLTHVCPACAAPWPVTSRSEVTAAVSWNADSFPYEQEEARMPCPDCRQVREEHAHKQRVLEQEAKQQRTAERSENAATWLADHANRPAPTGHPDLGEALALLSIVEIMDKAGQDTFGPLNRAGYTLTESAEADHEAVRHLYYDHWIAPSLPAKVNDFAYEDDNTVRGVYLSQVPLRITTAWSTNPRHARGMILQVMREYLLDHALDLQVLVRHLEASIALRYLDGLLDRQYREEPVPEHRRPDAHAAYLGALIDGFTLGQLIAITWSSAASSVAWGQRTPGLKPGSVAAACVTNLTRGIGFAKDRPVKEYDLPNWVPLPTTYATAQRILAVHTAELDAMSRFLRLRQRIASRDVDAMAFEEEAAAPAGGQPEPGYEDVLEDLKLGRQRPPAGPSITWAVLRPGGELEFRAAHVSEMQSEVGSAGAGVVDRIIMPEESTVNAYVAELVPASDATANPVADEMLRLLDCFDGPFFGPIAFFSVTPSRSRPQGLDEEQQEMLRAAYDVARGRVASL